MVHLKLVIKLFTIKQNKMLMLVSGWLEFSEVKCHWMVKQYEREAKSNIMNDTVWREWCANKHTYHTDTVNM